MKLIQVLSLSISSISLATACITAHVYQNDCIINPGDLVVAQVYDNGVEVCNGGASIFGASADTTFCIDGCSPGYTFCVTGNSGSAHVTSPNGYQADLARTAYNNDDYTCAIIPIGQSDEEDIKGTEYEGCFTDNYENCGDFAGCVLCDFEAYC